MDIQIKLGNIEEAIELHKQIPEFDIADPEKEYRERLFGKGPIILIAQINQQSIGYKVGYKEDEYFYSWMGGVVPGFRGIGVVAKLASQQEDIVRGLGIFKIRFKTQNKFKSMLIFALKNGFSIIGTVPFNGGEGFKILLEKELN